MLPKVSFCHLILSSLLTINLSITEDMETMAFQVTFHHNTRI